MSTNKIMCVNGGSSSLKFKLYEVRGVIDESSTLREKASKLHAITSGLVERIGHEDAIFNLKLESGKKIKEVRSIMNHDEAVALLLEALIKYDIVSSLNEITGIGNRTVMGGDEYPDSTLFDSKAYAKIESLTPLNPLHCPAILSCHRAFLKALPDVGQVAVFDTSFHTTMEPKEYIYAVPYEYYEKYDVRRYGAHGTSHKYLSTVTREEYLKGKEHTRIITLHIGSGASIAAVKDGKCVATSMGMTPLAGVIMGTRTGDIDPSIFPYLMKCTGKDADEISDIFNKKSGLLGISGVSNDTRDVEAKMLEGDYRSKLAVDMFVDKIADYIMMYYGKLGGCDMIVCSAGVFENSALFRKMTFDQVSEALNIKLDLKKNEETVRGKEGIISSDDSSVPVLVLPTDEELMIALDTIKILNK